jgi:hypothetical protein
LKREVADEKNLYLPTNEARTDFNFKVDRDLEFPFRKDVSQASKPESESESESKLEVATMKNGVKRCEPEKKCIVFKIFLR